MNYQAILSRINQYIENVDANQLIQSLEKKGYEFEDLFVGGLNIDRYVIFHPVDIVGTNGKYTAIINNERASYSCSFFFCHK